MSGAFAPWSWSREAAAAADLFAGGLTRTGVGPRHALLAPDGMVPAALPGWPAPTRVCVVLSPALGTRHFTQLHAELPPPGEGGGGDGGAAGQGGGPDDGRQRFLFVVDGELTLTLAGQPPRRLAAGGYGYAPAGTAYRAADPGPAGARLVVFEKAYAPLPGVPAPAARFGDAAAAVPVPFLGDPDALLATLLPDEPAFDLAVNLFRFAPGAALPFVETHVMEHGLLMLTGRGIYRLEDRWYPVRAGDAIWMAPFCPQWFGALGREGASYLYCKDVNRLP